MCEKFQVFDGFLHFKNRNDQSFFLKIGTITDGDAFQWFVYILPRKFTNRCIFQ